MITSYQTFLNESINKWEKTDPEYYGITEYEWNNGKLDCYQNVDLSNKELTKLPFNFGIIEGNFNCSSCVIENLEGAPESVKWDFYCSNNVITSLEGCPQTVGGSFSCSINRLNNLDNCPKSVGLNFYCYKNFQLTSLVGCPQKIGGNFDCAKTKLSDLTGCPKEILGKFRCDDSNISNIEQYPLSIIDGSINSDEMNIFRKVFKVVKANKNTFLPLLNDKIKFHQMVMRIDPDLIQYYNTIQPPAKKTMLFI